MTPRDGIVSIQLTVGSCQSSVKTMAAYIRTACTAFCISWQSRCYHYVSELALEYKFISAVILCPPDTFNIPAFHVFIAPASEYLIINSFILFFKTIYYFFLIANRRNPAHFVSNIVYTNFWLKKNSQSTGPTEFVNAIFF